MNFLKNLSIVTKIFLLSTIFVTVFFGISFLYSLSNLRAELTQSTLKILEIEVVHQKDRIEALITQIQDTTLALSGAPSFQGIIRAEAGDGFDQLENSTMEQWYGRLAAIFISEMRSITLYDQLRYIDEEGKELVRVDHDRGFIRRTPSELLQDKEDREYFVEASKMRKGQVYISRAELNREGDSLSVPYKPVIRFAVPIFDEVTNERKGILVGNVLLNQLIAKSYLVERASSHAYIIDDKGYYFVHPEEEKEWGGENDLGTGENFFEEFPDVTVGMLQNEYGSFYMKEDIFAYVKVLPNRTDMSRKWVIFQRVPTNVVLDPVDSIIKSASLFEFFSFVVLLCALLFITRRLLSPLKDLSLAAEDIGRGNLDQKINIRSKDEIGQLSAIFNDMTLKLKESHENLEQKVKTRTSELEDINKVMMGRESRVIELKKELKGIKDKYKIAEESDSDFYNSDI